MGSVREDSARGRNDSPFRSSVTKSSGNDLLTNLRTHFIPQPRDDWKGETPKGSWICIYCSAMLTVKEAKSWHNSGAEKHYKHCKDEIAAQLPSPIEKLTAEVRGYRRANCRLRQDIQCLSGGEWRQCWCNEGAALPVNCPFGHASEWDEGWNHRTTRDKPLQMRGAVGRQRAHQTGSCDCLYAPLVFPLRRNNLKPSEASATSINELDKTVVQLRKQYTQLTAIKYRVLHQVSPQLSVELLRDRLSYARCYLRDMKESIQRYAFAGGLQVCYDVHEAAGNLLNCGQLREKITKCLDEISRYSEIFLQIRVAITDAMLLAGWNPSLMPSDYFKMLAYFAPAESVHVTAASRQTTTAITDNNRLQERLTISNNWQFVEGTGFETSWSSGSQWPQGSPVLPSDVPAPSHHYLRQIGTPDYRIQLDADFFRIFQVYPWTKSRNLLSKRRAITRSGEYVEVKNESLRRKNPHVAEEMGTTNERDFNLKDTEARQEATMMAGLSRLGVMLDDQYVKLRASSQASHTLSDARRPISRGSTYRTTGIEHTGGFHRVHRASSCKSCLQTSGPQSCPLQIDGTSSAALLFSAGTGSDGPSIATVGVDGRRRRGHNANQSPADCRRMIQEWGQKTTRVEHRSKETKPDGERTSAIPPAEKALCLPTPIKFRQKLLPLPSLAITRLVKAISPLVKAVRIKSSKGKACGSVHSIAVKDGMMKCRVCNARFQSVYEPDAHKIVENADKDLCSRCKRQQIELHDLIAEALNLVTSVNRIMHENICLQTEASRVF